MPESLDWKLGAAVLSQLIGIAGFVPYLIGVFRKDTEPHLFTWLIWTLTFGIANASIWYGGGGTVLSIGLAINVFLCFLVTVLSLKYGTKNITRSDTVALVAALVAIFVWVGLDEPVLALLLATGIDLVGYWPTYRKSFAEPWSENLPAWIIYTVAPATTLVALLEYNVMTVTYSVATLLANLIIVTLLVSRRRSVRKPV